MTEYSWSVDSAIWQIQHSEPDDASQDRHESAYNWLFAQIGQTDDITMLRGIAVTLLQAVQPC